MTHEKGNGRFVGVRLRRDVPGLNPAVARWPDKEYDLSDQTTEPLEGYRVARPHETSLYFMVEQAGPGVTRWSSPSITYEQGRRTYTNTSPDCFFETDSKPMTG